MKKEENILRLPSHITLEILSRLPVKTVIHCSSVCKEWRNLLLDPCFPNLHLAKSPVNLMLYSHGAFPSYWLIEFEKDFHNRKLSKFKDECVVAGGQTSVVGSCNGLICLKDVTKEKDEQYYVWNPVKNDNIILPMPDLRKATEKFPFSSLPGFGFCPRTNVYKVIRTVTYSDKALRYQAMCEVCTFGTNAWRTIQDVPAPHLPPYYYISNMPSFNGAVHWFTDMCVCAFRIEDEEWDPILLTHPLLDYANDPRYCSELGVLENCLAIFHKSTDCSLNIWMMKEYGVQESWTKCWSIGSQISSQIHVCSLLPLKLTKDGDLLMFDRCNRALVCIDPLNQRICGLLKHQRHMSYGIAYVPSFISPSQVLKEEC